jgi:hypothetical protein
MWEPRRLTTLLAFMACSRDSFTFFLPLHRNIKIMNRPCHKPLANYLILLSGIEPRIIGQARSLGPV